MLMKSRPDHFLAVRQNRVRIHPGPEATFESAMLTFPTTLDSDSAIADGFAFETRASAVLR